MTQSDKHACGGNCGCGKNPQAVDPIAESTEVVWHNPGGYDLAQHGPSYLPKKARTAAYSYDRRVNKG